VGAARRCGVLVGLDVLANHPTRKPVAVRTLCGGPIRDYARLVVAAAAERAS
jgi:hypothetical protein